MKLSDIQGSSSFKKLNGNLESRCSKNIVLFIQCEPMGAPRMTRCDKWAKRPVVQRYFAYRDVIRSHVSKECKGLLPDVPVILNVHFFIPFPESWSEKKKNGQLGKPHRQRPDLDNLYKSVLDALFTEDGGVAEAWLGKTWVQPKDAGIRIELVYRPDESQE